VDMLQKMLGGSERAELEDFVGRYEKGSPWDGMADDEAVRRYHQIAPALAPQDYEEAARQAFERLTPAQRLEFGRYVRDRAGEQRSIFDRDGDGRDDRFQDPAELARMTGRLEQQQPGLLEQLLGGGRGTSGHPSPRGSSGGIGGMLGSPIGKAVLGGVAAMAMRKMMGR
jgi:hypothetical protein